MKKFMKKMLATVMASSCMFSAVAMNGNALYSIKNINEFSKFDSDEYILLDKKYNDYFVDDYIYSDEQIRNTSIYFKKGTTMVYALIPMKEKFGEGALFNLTDGTTEEEVEAFLSKKIAADYNVVKFWSGYDYKISASLKECREVCNLLKEENLIDSFVIIDNIWQEKWYSYELGDILGFSCTEEQLELLENYVKETDIADIQVKSEDEYYTDVILVTKTETTDEERFDIAFQIWESTGIGCNCVSPENNNTESSYIDVFNAVDGDANEDGKMNMADATAVVQAIGNPDKYALTPQGSFNADTDSDGITGVDALGIQMKVAEAGMPE